MELEGRAAIVTGAARGIGRATALELAGLGADVVVADLDSEAASATADAVEAAGRRSLAIGVDITAAADRTAMLDRTLDAFGRVDILVNNAGIYGEMEPLAITEEHWDTILAVNAKAVVFCTQAVLPAMLASGGGAVVNVSSIAAKGGSAHGLAYAPARRQ